MAGAPISSKLSYLTYATVKMDDITNITVSQTNDAQAYGSSDTGGYIHRVAGHNDSSITFTQLCSGGVFGGITIGATVALIVTASGGAANKTWTGSYVITDISQSVPIGDGGIVSRDVTAAQQDTPTGAA